jgi:DUF4097 and DUF4098 domain-containing protein YvlB
MKPMRKTQILLAGWFLLLISQCAFASDATGSFSRNLTVSDSPNIEVQTGSGNITVRTGAGDRVNIEARIRANDNNGRGWFGGGDSKLTAEERVKRIEANPPVQQNGNTIVIGKIEDEQVRNNVSISYEITVPSSTRLESRTGSGSQRIQDIRGPVRASTGSGTIELGKIGDEVDAQSGSGGIEIGGATGNVTARTGSGHIRLHDIKAGLRASTGSGGIEVDGDARNEWDLHTGSGGISVRTPSSAGFRVDAESGSGGVTINKPVTMQGSISRNHIEGTIGNGGPMMRLRTGSGGIHVD